MRPTKSYIARRTCPEWSVYKTSVAKEQATNCDLHRLQCLLAICDQQCPTPTLKPRKPSMKLKCKYLLEEYFRWVLRLEQQDCKGHRSPSCHHHHSTLRRRNYFLKCQALEDSLYHKLWNTQKNLFFPCDLKSERLVACWASGDKAKRRQTQTPNRKCQIRTHSPRKFQRRSGRIGENFNLCHKARENTQCFQLAFPNQSRGHLGSKCLQISSFSISKLLYITKLWKA